MWLYSGSTLPLCHCATVPPMSSIFVAKLWVLYSEDATPRFNFCHVILGTYDYNNMLKVYCLPI